MFSIVLTPSTCRSRSKNVPSGSPILSMRAETETTAEPATPGETEAPADTAAPAGTEKPEGTPAADRQAGTPGRPEGQGGGFGGGFPGGGDFPGGGFAGETTNYSDYWIQAAICAGILLLALLVIRKAGSHNNG